MHPEHTDTWAELAVKVLTLITALVALYRTEHNGRKIKAIGRRCENFTTDGKCPFAPAKKED
jgi:hypothetical protein